LKQTRPTAIFAVPRIWEKMHDSVLKKIHEAPLWRYILYLWSMNIAKSAIEHKNAGYEITGILGMKYSFVKNFIFPTIKEALGFGRIEICISGAAPIDVKTLEFFAGLDIQ
jgi:long-chain acyl-CoA synthetase